MLTDDTILNIMKMFNSGYLGLKYIARTKLTQVVLVNRGDHQFCTVSHGRNTASVSEHWAKFFAIVRISKHLTDFVAGRICQTKSR